MTLHLTTLLQSTTRITRHLSRRLRARRMRNRSPWLRRFHFKHQFGTYAFSVFTPSSQDQVRTLFRAGLPEDVKPREIYNLFREFPGYQTTSPQISVPRPHLAVGHLPLQLLQINRLHSWLCIL